MDLVKLLGTIKSSFPSKGRELFISALKEEQELLTALVSFELHHTYQFSPAVSSSKNSETFTILEALARVCYWLNEAEYTDAKKEFRKLPTEQQKILSDIFNKTFTKSLGKDFLLDTLPRLYDLKDLYCSFIKLPERLSNDFETHLQGVDREFKFSSAQLPAALLNVPKSARKSSRLFYLVKRGNTVHSNLSNKLVRDLFLSNFHFNSFGVIFLFSKRENKKYGKHLTPLCLSMNYKDIISLYRGGSEINFSSLDFDVKKYFSGVNSPSTEIKYAQVKLFDNSEQLTEYLPKVSENNFFIFANGISRIRFKGVNRLEKVSDFILDEEYIPEGLILASGEKYLVNISEEFIEGGLENRYVTVTDTVLGDKIVRSTIYDILGKGYFECVDCGVISKSNFKGLCSKCYNHIKYISEFSIEPKMTFHRPVSSSYSITVGKYLVEGKEDKVIFSLNLDLVKGKQLSLPFNENLGE